MRKRTDIPFGWVGWVFGAFIVACGVTHALSVWTLWYPVYWYAGVAKAFTAAVSLGTAWLLYRLTPAALSMPSAEDLRRANEALRAEVQARMAAEAALATARRQVQDLLRKVEGEARTTSAVLDRFFDEAPVGLALIGADGRVLRLNAALTSGTGRTPPESIGSDVTALAPVDGDLLHAIDEVRSGAQRRTLQVVRHQGDEEQILRCTLFSIPVESGPGLTGAVVLDVTAQEQLSAQRARSVDELRDTVAHLKAREEAERALRRAEEALNDARSELAHVSRVNSLSTLTASITHEVSQPLSGIISNAQTCARILASEAPRIEEAANVVRRILRDANRGVEVVTRLRAMFSKKALTLEPFDLNEATREVLALSAGEIQRNHVRLRCELAKDLPRVLGDRVQLQQVILNMIRNASEAMADIQDRPRDLVVRTTSQGEDGVCLSVQDAGTGLSPEAAGNVFQPFYTTKSSGMGIGLSVSRSIIERHHGRIWAEPNEGPGATFSFRVEAADGHRPD